MQVSARGRKAEPFFGVSPDTEAGAVGSRNTAAMVLDTLSKDEEIGERNLRASCAECLEVKEFVDRGSSDCCEGRMLKRRRVERRMIAGELVFPAASSESGVNAHGVVRHEDGGGLGAQE